MTTITRANIKQLNDERIKANKRPFTAEEIADIFTRTPVGRP